MPELLPVAPFQETLNAGMCGPASLKMVLAYYGVEKTETELATLCSTDSTLGTTDEGIRRAAERLGFVVAIHNESSYADIHTWLDKRVPVIVNWFTRGRADYPDTAVADGHYSVVVGLDTENIYVQDPELGTMRTMSREDFLRVWFDFRPEFITNWEDMIVRQLIAIYPR